MRLVSLQTPCPVWALCLKNNGRKSKERCEREMVPWRTEKGKDIHLGEKSKAGEILDTGFMFLKGQYWLEGPLCRSFLRKEQTEGSQVSWDEELAVYKRHSKQAVTPDGMVNLYCQLVWIEVTKEHAPGCHYDGVFREL